MGNTKSAEKKGIGALNWTLLLVIGFSERCPTASARAKSS